MDTAREFGFDVGRMENEIDRLRGRINAALALPAGSQPGYASAVDKADLDRALTEGSE